MNHLSGSEITLSTIERIKLMTYDRRQYRLLSELVRSVCNLELVIDSKNRNKRNATQWHVDQALRTVYSLFMKKHPSWVGRQQDPQEFITLLISYMDDDLTKYHLLMYGNISLVARKTLACLFEIQFSVQLTCTRCGHSKPKFSERDQSLRLNVSDDDSPLQSVVSLAEKYLQTDEVVCVCEKCNRNTFFKQVRKISRYPEHLSVVIGRCPEQSMFTGTLWKCKNLIQIEPIIGTFESGCLDVAKLESKQDLSIESTLVAYENSAATQSIAYKPLCTEDVNNIKVLLNIDDTTQFTDCDIFDCHHCSRNPQETCLLKMNEAPRTLSIEGDGNCLFRALSWWIYHGNDGYYTSLREKIVGFIESHKERFAELLPKNSSIDNHMRKMRMNRCWGTHVELSGAATFFRCSIFTFHKGKWAEYKPFFGKNVTSNNAIYIDNRKGNHFDVVIGQLPSAAENQRSLYRLRSVICHEGYSSDSGHCYCFLYDYFSRTWYKCSDTDIDKVDESLVLKESMQAGYILGYKKQSEDNIKLDWSSENIADPLSKNTRKGVLRPPKKQVPQQATIAFSSPMGQNPRKKLGRPPKNLSQELDADISRAVSPFFGTDDVSTSESVLEESLRRNHCSLNETALVPLKDRIAMMSQSMQGRYVQAYPEKALEMGLLETSGSSTTTIEPFVVSSLACSSENIADPLSRNPRKRGGQVLKTKTRVNAFKQPKLSS